MPVKLNEQDEQAYNKFLDWRGSKKILNLAEPVFLTYFNELSEK